MNPDPFEEELARVPLRPPPAAWREEILASVLPAACRHERQPAHRAGRMAAAPSAAFGAFCSFCRTHLSPGWSAVAAVWLVILGLNRLAASGDAPAAARPPLSPDYIAAVRAQQAELLRLAELDAPVPAPPPAPATTGPDDKPRPRGPRAQWPHITGAPEARLAALDCGGQRSATPLGAAPGTAGCGTPGHAGSESGIEGNPSFAAKAPLPLRSAGALQDVSLELAPWNFLGAWNLELGA